MKIISLKNNAVNNILTLENESAPEKPYYMKYSLNDLKYLFNNRNECGVYGVYFKKRLIGWSSYRKHKEHLYEVGSLVIDNCHKRKGMGYKLFIYTIKKILENDTKAEIFLTVYPHNTEALLLYLNYNFQIYDFKQDYFGPKADRLFLKYIKNHKKLSS